VLLIFFKFSEQHSAEERGLQECRKNKKRETEYLRFTLGSLLIVKYLRKFIGKNITRRDLEIFVTYPPEISHKIQSSTALKITK